MIYNNNNDNNRNQNNNVNTNITGNHNRNESDERKIELVDDDNNDGNVSDSYSESQRRTSVGSAARRSSATNKTFQFATFDLSINDFKSRILKRFGIGNNNYQSFGNSSPQISQEFLNDYVRLGYTLRSINNDKITIFIENNSELFGELLNRIRDDLLWPNIVEVVAVPLSPKVDKIECIEAGKMHITLASGDYNSNKNNGTSRESFINNRGLLTSILENESKSQSQGGYVEYECKYQIKSNQFKFETTKHVSAAQVQNAQNHNMLVLNNIPSIAGNNIETSDMKIRISLRAKIGGTNSNNNNNNNNRGKLGLTSHHGIQLNGFKNIEIKNVEMHHNHFQHKVSQFYAHLKHYLPICR